MTVVKVAFDITAEVSHCQTKRIEKKRHLKYRSANNARVKTRLNNEGMGCHGNGTRKATRCLL